ncbi:MAG: hypothetical protein AAF800_02405 [Planctomycetota bacterium]
MPTASTPGRIYDGSGDTLIAADQFSEKLSLIPEGKPASASDTRPRLRIMWGQYLLDDVLAGRYRTLVCAVNAEDNGRGVIAQLAELLPTSMWTPESVTDYARRFAGQDRTVVLKYDMDMVEVLALLRPASHASLTLDDLGHGFGVVSQMLRRKTDRRPTASVSFLGARANRLLAGDAEPSFETVLRTMDEAGFDGDVYPAPWMWDAQPTAVYCRYPFPDSVARMRSGGF